MARRVQILIEADLETGDTKVTAPWHKMGLVLQMLGNALKMAGQASLQQTQHYEAEIAKLKDGRTESGLIVAKGRGRSDA